VNVLLLGGGGREHALGWKLSQSPLPSELISAPGNPGLAELRPLVEVNPSDPDAVAAFAERREIDLVSADGRVANGAGREDPLEGTLT
jgi:phosphoribosylamine--glycine ligase